MGRKIIHMADIITGVSHDTILTTVPRVDIRRSHVIYNGVDYHQFKYRSKKNCRVSTVGMELGFEGKTVIMNNGRLVPQKGQKYLLKAFAKLSKDYDDLRLLIIGSGPLESQLRSMAERLNVDKDMKITYGISEEMLPYYFNIADIFAFPSLFEPAGMALLEAAACRVPAVAAKVGGIPEMIGEYGIYTRPKSAEDIEDKIRYVIENRGEVEKMTRSARKLIERKHDWDRIARQYENVFEESMGA